MTGVPEVDEKFLLSLDPYSLRNACQVNSYFNSLCQNDIFWKKKAELDFGLNVVSFKPSEETHREQYIRLVNTELTSKKYKQAVDADQLDTLEWFYENGLLLTNLDSRIGNPGTYARMTASRKGEEGNLPFLQWLARIPEYEDLIDFVLDGAVGEGHIHMLEWAELVKIPLLEKYVDSATLNDNLEVVQWFVQREIYPSMDAIQEAEEEGESEETLDWLSSIGYI